MDNIKYVIDFPTCIGNSHESLLRSYQTLELVKEMLKRGDSSETILMVIKHIES